MDNTKDGSSPPNSHRRRYAPGWTEHESFALLDAWEEYLKDGRKNLSSEDWHEVAVKVSEGSMFNRTETQCRDRLDNLKKKYKKEKAMQAGNVDFVSKFGYFRKMDLLISRKQGNGGTGNCAESGSGNGSLVAYVHPVNAYSSDEAKVDEVKDNSVGDNVDDFAKPEGVTNNVPPKKKRRVSNKGVGEALELLANSIKKFGTVYEKMETCKMNQMAYLEKMKMEFYRDLEVQKGKMLIQNQVKIAKILGVTLGDNDNNNSTNNDNNTNV